MKRILISALALGLCFLISCSSKDASGGKMSDKAKKNLDAVHTVDAAFMSGDVSKLDDVIASDFVDHTDRGDMSKDSLKSMITMMHKGSSDVKIDVVKEFADDDYVFSWSTFAGNSDGSMGMPKGPFSTNGMEVIKFKDGKAVEHWEFQLPAEMMKMMGQQPTDTSHMKMMEKGMDTTKKM